MPTAAVNGIELYYERSGHGPRLLFLNGSGSSIATSELLIKLFTGDFDVLVHDQRGLGRTEIPPGPYTMADYAADAAALLDRVGWERCNVVGVSFGGMVAQELAVTYPERVDRLALLCTSPGVPAARRTRSTSWPAFPNVERAARGTVLLDTRFTPEWLAGHAGDRALAEMMAARRGAEKSAEAFLGEAEQLAARSHHDVYDRLPNITCPTFVACGRFDGIAPPSNSEAIAARIPDAQLKIYDGGHAFFAQDPAALPDVIGFLGGNDVRS